MAILALSFVNAQWFQNLILATIIFASLLVGIETYHVELAAYKPIFLVLDRAVLAIFTLEVILKMTALWPRPQEYFRDNWNVFDFLIVAVCYLPFAGPFVTVLRLARIFRVLKLIKIFPELQILVGALLKSIPSMGYVGLLLFLLFYIYACMAVSIFGGNDPVHFGNLQIAFLSLFRIITLEDWTDLMYIAMNGCDEYGYDGMQHLCTQSVARPLGGALFFSSFVMVGTMIVLNLFIGVIMTGMEETQKEHEIKRLHEGVAKNPVESMQDQMIRLEHSLAEAHLQLDILRTMTKEAQASLREWSKKR